MLLVPLSPNAKKKIFGTKKHHLVKTSGKKKKFHQNNCHRNITDLGTCMSHFQLNHQLTTCLKSETDQMKKKDSKQCLSDPPPTTVMVNKEN